MSGQGEHRPVITKATSSTSRLATRHHAACSCGWGDRQQYDSAGLAQAAHDDHVLTVIATEV